MSKLLGDFDRSKLPPGVGWANWSGRKATNSDWVRFGQEIKQKFRVRFEQIVVTRSSGRLLPREKFYIIKKTGGIGKAKIRTPELSYRAWMFQDGPIWYVTHVVPKADDHDEQTQIAINARDEHMRRKGKQ